MKDKIHIFTAVKTLLRIDPFLEINKIIRAVKLRGFRVIDDKVRPLSLSYIRT
jgi:hypothetical protein